MRITSLQNHHIKNVVKLHQRRYRDRQGKMIIEGYRAVLRAVENGYPLDTLYVCPSLFFGKNEAWLMDAVRETGAQVIEVAEPAFLKMAYRQRPEGLLGVAPQVRHVLTDQRAEVNGFYLIAESIDVAIATRPDNAPSLNQLRMIYEDATSISVELLARNTTRYWSRDQTELSVSFVSDFSRREKSQILRLMNAWCQSAAISFRPTNGIGEVRISNQPTGNWSYQGTDLLLVPINQPTTNLDSYSGNGDQQRNRQVVLHQAGRILGFGQRGLLKNDLGRIKRAQCEDYILRLLGWENEFTRQKLFANELEFPSVMSWELPSSVTHDGRPILANQDFGVTDVAQFQHIYGTGPLT